MTSRRRSKYYRYAEIAAVSFAFIWVIFYNLVTPFNAVDLDIFMAAASGRDITGFYYAPWSLPFFYILSQMPYVLARICAGLLTTAGFLYAINVFKGNKILFFTSYALIFTIFYGQVEGVFAAGLAYMYLSLKKEQTFKASLGWLVAITKFHVGLPLGLGLWWMFARDHRTRLQILGLMTAYFAVSLVLWPGWVEDLLTRVRESQIIGFYGFSFWETFGPVLLLFWVPVFLTRTQDYRWWVAAWALTVPHFHVHNLAHVLTFPTMGVGWLGHLAYFTGYDNYAYLMIIPFALYVASFWNWWQKGNTVDENVQSLTAVGESPKAVKL